MRSDLGGFRSALIVIGIDPGLTVGTCIYSVELHALKAEEIAFEAFGDWLNAALKEFEFEDQVMVVAERFSITQYTLKGKTADAHWAIEINGVSRYLTRCYSRTLRLQLVGPVKQFSQDKDMRDTGWYIIGKGHANDSVRHVIYALADALKIYPDWIDRKQMHAGPRPEQLDRIDWMAKYGARRALLLILNKRTDG